MAEPLASTMVEALALGAVVWLGLGVLVGLAFGAAESLGGKREVLGVLKWRWQPVALLLAALLLGGCSSSTALRLLVPSAAAILENRPYQKAVVTQAEITSDRFDCERDQQASTPQALDACMLAKGYAVTR